MIPRTTRRADRKALVEAGKAFHAAKLAYGYSPSAAPLGTYTEARAALVHAAECYAVGRRKASTEYGIAHYSKSKSA